MKDYFELEANWTSKIKYFLLQMQKPELLLAASEVLRNPEAELVGVRSCSFQYLAHLLFLGECLPKAGTVTGSCGVTTLYIIDMRLLKTYASWFGEVGYIMSACFSEQLHWINKVDDVLRLD